MREIVPENAAVVEAFGDVAGASLLPEELQYIERAVEKRRREFAAGRTCARAALAQLGLPAVPILRGPQREPLWPVDVIGSITHCEGYAAAVVARSGQLAAIGIDAEIDAPLPEDVIRLVGSREEQAAIANLQRNGVCWDRLLFSAKESVFKAWFPVMQCWLDFLDVRLEFHPESQSFSARLLRPARALEERPFSCFHGRYAVGDGLVVTCTSVRAVVREL